MQNPPPVQTAKSSTGLDENLAALLSYIFGWLSGLIFFLIEKESRLVRFHAMQSLLLNVVALVIGIALWFLSIVSWVIVSQISGILSFLISVIVGLVAFVLFAGILVAVIMCLIKAYQGQYFKLPIIGNLAEKFSAK
ncbi:MAG TPA: DUF4870 domain-containing protein [Pyrinomonadaceae bacterium]|nr:DUF4870 domain-containing protein [Pyrinomonadaceae bacterium]